MRYEQQIRRLFDVKGRSGNEFVCTCPWHGDGGKPNLYVNGVNGRYLCQSCGRKGHMEMITGELPQASAQDLRDRLARISAPPPEALHVYSERWLRRFNHVHPGWYERGFSEEVMARFNLGYDPIKDVLTIPVRNTDGDLLGVITRRLDNLKPKYMYPKGFPIGRFLFGAWLLQQERRQTVALVEGTVDAIACWDARVPALAMMGSRLTLDQRGVLKRLGVSAAVIFTDNDKAGIEAVDQIHQMLAGSGITTKVAAYRPYWSAKDPAELNEQRRRKAYHSALPWHRWAEMRLTQPQAVLR